MLNYITTSVNILWGLQYSVMCVYGKIGEFVIASSKTLDTFIPHQDNMPQDVYSFITDV